MPTGTSPRRCLRRRWHRTRRSARTASDTRGRPEPRGSVGRARPSGAARTTGVWTGELALLTAARHAIVAEADPAIMRRGIDARATPAPKRAGCGLNRHRCTHRLWTSWWSWPLGHSLAQTRRIGPYQAQRRAVSGAPVGLICRYFGAWEPDERHASHARCRWFETSRAGRRTSTRCRVGWNAGARAWRSASPRMQERRRARSRAGGRRDLVVPGEGPTRLTRDDRCLGKQQRAGRWASSAHRSVAWRPLHK
jgi:hypothetical protein